MKIGRLRLPAAEIFFTGICVYRIALDWIYFDILTESSQYPDFQDGNTFVLSWLLLFFSFPLVLRLLTSRDEERVSDLIVAGLYLFSFVPFTTCVRAGMFLDGLVVYNVVFWAVFLITEATLLGIRVQPFPYLTAGSTRVDDKFLKLAWLFLVLAVVYISWRYTNFRLHFDLRTVYELRMEARTYNYSKYLHYGLEWARMINPLMLVYFAVKGKKGLACLCFATQVLSFGIEAHKSELFSVILAVVIAFGYHKITTRQLKSFMVWGLVGLCFAGILEIILFQSKIIVDLFVRRIMFVPNQIHQFYYDFFMTRGNELAWMRGGADLLLHEICRCCGSLYAGPSSYWGNLFWKPGYSGQ